MPLPSVALSQPDAIPAGVDDSHAAGEWAIVQCASDQHGVFTTAQLIAAGIGPSGIKRRVRAGRLHRLHHGVYALTPPGLVRPLGRLEAAVLAVGPGSAIAMQSAANLHGLLGYRPANPHVIVKRDGGRRRRPGIHVHVSSTLRLDRDVTVVNGIRVTTVARTFLDLACVLGEEQMLRLIDGAAAASLLDPVALEDQITHLDARVQQRSALRRLLDLYEVSRTIDWNRIQRHFLEMVHTYGLPEPESQVWLDLHDGEQPIRPDFLWRRARLIVETDGWGTHGTRRSFERDRRRDQRAAAAGFQTLRVTWRQIAVDARRLAQTISPLANRDLGGQQSLAGAKRPQRAA